MSLKHDDLYARAWECEYEKLIFAKNYDNAVTPSSTEISDLPANEFCNTPGTAQEHSWENFQQTDELCDITQSNPHLEPDAEMRSEQPNLNPTNHCISKYNLLHNPKPICNDDYRY